MYSLITDQLPTKRKGIITQQRVMLILTPAKQEPKNQNGKTLSPEK